MNEQYESKISKFGKKLRNYQNVLTCKFEFYSSSFKINIRRVDSMYHKSSTMNMLAQTTFVSNKSYFVPKPMQHTL